MQIKESIHQTLHQLEFVLHQLSDEEYTQALTIINHQTIGKHVRHIVEFFQCLILADKVICYDDRQRELQIETSIEFTLNCIQQINDGIDTLDFDQAIVLKQLINQQTFQVQSSIGRELIYCIDHSIHHFAIIKMVLKECFPSIKIDENFGIAYSTLNYQANHE